jgi:hypothetical protein
LLRRLSEGVSESPVMALVRRGKYRYGDAQADIRPACYGDWKNEFEGYRELLVRV